MRHSNQKIDQALVMMGNVKSEMEQRAKNFPDLQEAYLDCALGMVTLIGCVQTLKDDEP